MVRTHHHGGRGYPNSYHHDCIFHQSMNLRVYSVGRHNDLHGHNGDQYNHPLVYKEDHHNFLQQCMSGQHNHHPVSNPSVSQLFRYHLSNRPRRIKAFRVQVGCNLHLSISNQEKKNIQSRTRAHTCVQVVALQSAPFVLQPELQGQLQYDVQNEPHPPEHVGSGFPDP